MKQSSDHIANLRSDLLSKENKLMKKMDAESQVLEGQLESGLKIAAMVGGIALAGFALYKVFGSKPSPSTEEKTKPKKHVKAELSSMTSTAITFALGKILPIIVDKLGSKK